MHQIKNMPLRTLCAAALAALTFASCETEVDLNAPYKEYTTVYGLLDLSADTQIVRINKSFLGAGSAYDFAQVKDSSEYNPDEVEAFIEFGNHSVELEPHYLDREPGTFYHEDVMVFITTENLALDNQGNLITNVNDYDQLPDEYKLVVKVKGKTITGTTVPVYLRNSGNQDQPNPNISLNWGSTSNGVDNFATSFVEKGSSPDGYLYQAKVIFHYTDYYVGDSEGVAKSLTFDLGRKSVESGEVTFQYYPETILTQLANSVDCENVAYRTIQPVEFVMTMAGEELARYISINNPVTGVVTERPDYSNVEGEDAIGLFSSRYTWRMFMEVQSNTKELIINGATSGQLCFCDPNSATYDCPDINTPCNCSN